MAIAGILQYTGGFVPDVLLFTQTSILVWFDVTNIVHYYYPLNYVIHCLMFLLCLVALHGD